MCLVGYCFMVGQFVCLGLEIDGEVVLCVYFIILVEGDDYLEYYVIIVFEGKFILCLNQLQLGDVVWVEKFSYGFMMVDCFVDGWQVWMLVMGIGLGFYVVILQQLDVWQWFSDLVVVYGVCQCEELVYVEIFVCLQ